MKSFLEKHINRLKPFYSANKFAVWFFSVLWLSLSLITSHKDILYFSIQDEYTVEIWVLYFRGFLLWTLAACFVPLILKLAHRFPVYEIKNQWRNLLFHLIFSICFLFALGFVFTLIFYFFFWSENSFGEALLWVMSWYSLGAPVAYWFIIGGLLWKQNLHLYNERRERSLALQSELKKIQLKVLQVQLRPHFLFNALNTVSSLIYDDYQVAARTVRKIRKYLEMAMRESSKTEISLQEELKFTNLYIDIEKERFSDHLQVVHDIAPEILDALVPAMILQPLVENAIQHGISKKKGPGKLRVRAFKSENFIILGVEDSGMGLDAIGALKSDGLGIKNSIERLEKLYDDNYEFQIGHSDLGGCKVMFRIPLNIPVQKAELSYSI